MTDLRHVDETGQPCSRHPAPALDPILTFAALGARVGSFNHDIASKLQGLMMAFDELAELAESRRDAALLQPIEIARSTLDELHGLLTANRALARPSVKSATSLRELAEKAGERVGVTLRGELADTRVDVVAPTVIHALSLAIDAVAGAGRTRAIDALITPTAPRGGALVLRGPGTQVAVAYALAQHLLGAGALACSPDGVVITL
jgi:hypothetical protein